MPNPLATVASLGPGQSGWIDPYWLVEGRRPRAEQPPSLEPGAAPPPPYDPHSGTYFVASQAPVFAERVDEHRMPLAKDKDGLLVADFGPNAVGGPKLNHSPRLEPASALEGYQVVTVRGLANALAIDPPPAEEDRPSAAKKPREPAKS